MGYVDAFHVEVNCREGHVILTGRVDSREERLAIEAMVDTVPGVTEITNGLMIGEAKDETERAA
jgi:osmotically-inducible protein OsmY